MGDDNHQSANGDVARSSAAAVSQQQAPQSTAPADVPAYTYAPTWPGYAVRMSNVMYQFTQKMHLRRTFDCVVNLSKFLQLCFLYVSLLTVLTRKELIRRAFIPGGTKKHPKHSHVLCSRVIDRFLKFLHRYIHR